MPGLPDTSPGVSANAPERRLHTLERGRMRLIEYRVGLKHRSLSPRFPGASVHAPAKIGTSLLNKLTCFDCLVRYLVRERLAGLTFLVLLLCPNGGHRRVQTMGAIGIIGEQRAQKDRE